MRNVSSRILLVFAALLLLAGCRSAPVYNAKDVSLGAQGKSLEDVSQAIQRAGIGLGWEMKEEGPGKIRGILNVRTHRAEVLISYNTTAFSIDYASSVNLNYDAGKNEIHGNYNGWVQNLEKAIRVQMSR